MAGPSKPLLRGNEPSNNVRLVPAMASPLALLKFRCTGCGNCCRDPLLPLTDEDVRRIVEHTGDAAMDVVRFVDRNAIDMDDEPEAFAILRQGRRVMVLRQRASGCKYLDHEERCSIYDARPLGCRIFPFDPSYDRKGKLKRLELIPATNCIYELDGKNSPSALTRLHTRYEEATRLYHEKLATWNTLQKRRKRAGRSAQTARELLAFLEVTPPPVAKNTP